MPEAFHDHDDQGRVRPPRAARDGQQHFVAELDQTPLLAVDAPDESQRPSSLWRDAWVDLRRQPMFWISAALIVLALTVAAVPSLFTSVDPKYCQLTKSLEPASSGHPFGFDRQGCDVYARVIFGARASVSVGVVTTIGVTLLGGIVGAVAGYLGGWVDSLLSRLGDIFFAVPLILAAVVFMTAFPELRSVLSVSAVMIVFFWPQIARITRGAVVSVKSSEFVTAARALGASDGSILTRHVIPNSLAPVIVTATVALGTFIVVEATLSFLGVGLPPGVVSWGADISAARATMRTNPLVLIYPAAALAVTILSFIMMGDVVRDALDPKARTR